VNGTGQLEVISAGLLVVQETVLAVPSEQQACQRPAVRGCGQLEMVQGGTVVGVDGSMRVSALA